MSRELDNGQEDPQREFFPQPIARKIGAVCVLGLGAAIEVLAWQDYHNQGQTEGLIGMAIGAIALPAAWQTWHGAKNKNQTQGNI